MYLIHYNVLIMAASVMESAILTMDAAGVTNDMKNFNWILFLTVAICSLNAAPHQKMLVRSSKLLSCRLVIISTRGPKCHKGTVSSDLGFILYVSRPGTAMEHVVLQPSFGICALYLGWPP